MTPGRSIRTAVSWVIAGAGLAAVATTFWATWFIGGRGFDIVFGGIFLVLACDLLIVGAVITTRRPENLIGPLLLGSGLLTVVGFGGGPYGALDQALGGGRLPLVPVAVWLGWWTPTLLLASLMVVLPLFFPTGRLLGPRWRVAFGGTLLVLAAATLRDAFAVDQVSASDVGVANPFAVGEPWRAGLVAAGSVADAVGPLVFVVGVASVIVRFRRSRGIERAQLKWFVLVASVAGIAFVPGVAGYEAGWIVGLTALALLPVVIGLSIVRYRLYEIDRIISRTLAYAALSIVLAGVYGVGFLLAQAVLSPMTGNSDPIAVAASTLGIFGLFQPLRRRLQDAMDRRFNRSRYHAGRTVELFTDRLRDEVDLTSVTAALESVAAINLQPAGAAVWIRGRGPVQ